MGLIDFLWCLTLCVAVDWCVCVLDLLGWRVGDFGWVWLCFLFGLVCELTWGACGFVVFVGVCLFGWWVIVW